MRHLRWAYRFLADIVREFRRDGVGDLGASITFWTVLSIPAATLALVSAMGPLERVVGAEVADSFRRAVYERVRDTFADSAPLESAVDDLFTTDQSSVLTLGTLIALYSMSRGFAGMVRALDHIYRVRERRAWWHVRIVAFGLGTGTVGVVAATATLLAVLSSRLGAFASVVLTVVSLLVLIGWAATVFHLGPNHATPWRYDLVGAIFTAVGWTLATQGFALYVRLSRDGNEVQSTVGALILGISLLYLLVIVMLIGAEINDILTRRAGVAQVPPTMRQRVEQARAQLEDRRDRRGDRR
jgi:membrane protein